MANKTMHHVIIGADTYEIVDQTARQTDTTLTQSGMAADAKAVGDALSGYGSGVPSSVRQAMLTLFQKAAYIEEGLADEVAVVQAWASEVTAITISASAISIHGATTSQLSAVTTPAGGAVTWESSNTAVATVSNTGLVTGVSNGTAVITARSGDVSATCTATVSGFATLTGIDAVYTQSGTVYDTASLNDLKTDLVVTGTYDDSTTAVITDYTLSGTLAEGTSTITVSYGGFTDTFTVVVSGPTIVVPTFDDGTVKYYSPQTTSSYVGLGYKASRSAYVLDAGEHKLRARQNDSTSFLNVEEVDLYPFLIPSGAETVTITSATSCGALIIVAQYTDGMYVRSNGTVNYDSNATSHTIDVSDYNDGTYYLIPSFNAVVSGEDASVTFA